MNAPLQSENFSLRQQLEALLREARCNEDKMRRFDQLEQQLIAAGSLRVLLRLLLGEYKQAFAVEFVTLALVDRDDEARQILASGPVSATDFDDLTLLESSDALAALYGKQRRPCLGDFAAAPHQSLFTAAVGAIRTVALLPLTRRGELIGSLHLGSACADRYSSTHGTDFLERLAQIVAICLENALSQERLKLVGLTDALTGVQNRRYFEHRCPVEISQARRYKHPLACLFLDIDKFKRINDSYGHPTGDEVLRSVARLIQSQLRSGDTIARYGGEEFVVLLPKSELHQALQIAERIRASVEEKPFTANAGQPIKVTLSIGLSMLPAKNLAADNRQCAEHLLSAADQALYQAKHQGRNRVECAGGLPRVTARRLLSRVLRSFARFPLAIFAKCRGA